MCGTQHKPLGSGSQRHALFLVPLTPHWNSLPLLQMAPLQNSGAAVVFKNNEYSELWHWCVVEEALKAFGKGMNENKALPWCWSWCQFHNSFTVKHRAVQTRCPRPKSKSIKALSPTIIGVEHKQKAFGGLQKRSPTLCNTQEGFVKQGDSGNVLYYYQ